MGEVLHRLLQAIRFDREAYVWMDFNDRATGDALILVAVTQLLLIIGQGTSIFGLVSGLPSVISALISAAIFWLIYSGLVYAAAKYLFQGYGAYATFLRIVGFAYPTLLLLLFTERIFTSPLLSFLLGSVWFVAIVAYGVHYISDLALGKAAGSAVLGMVGWVIVSAILSGLRLF